MLKHLQNQILMQKHKVFVVVLMAILAAVFYSVFIKKSKTADGSRQVLYWVAPMDPNYRRDEPGQSPMGMDLIPVYEEPANSAPGVVSLSPELQQQMGVRKVEVVKGVLEQRLLSFGRVTFYQTRVSKLSPRVTGWVDSLFVATEGEAVKRGQPLYSLYSKELIEAQEQFLKIYSTGNKQRILRAESELKALNMDDSAITQLKEQGVAQQSVVFRAQKDGVVGMLKTGEDYFVEPGDLLMAIGTLDVVWVELNIFESQAGLIKSGQFVLIRTPAYPGLVWDGEVDYIYPSLNSKERSLLFRARIENPMMRLRPNMHVQASIRLPEREPALLVPRQAVISLGEAHHAVLDLGEGKFKSVAVTLGESNGEFVEIVEGLEQGDIIVNSAHFLIDSESSKTSDFQRMARVEDTKMKYPPTWVKATILDISHEKQEIRLKHEYIEDWKMPSMTMNFSYSDDLDFGSVSIHQNVRVKVTDGDPLFQVIDLEPLNSGAGSQAK